MIGTAFPRVLADAQAGDDGAFEEIYRDVAPLVIGYLRSNGAPDPEDVASEVFVAVVRGIGRFSGDESEFRSWLLTIAYRRMVDERRRRGRRKETLVEAGESPTDVINLTDGESEALARLGAQGVLEVIDGLTDDQRSALMLRVLADLRVREIAEIMGKSETAVKALLRRAVASVERSLEDD